MGYDELIEMLSKIPMKEDKKTNIIYATYNIYHNSIDIYLCRLLFTDRLRKSRRRIENHSLF